MSPISLLGIISNDAPPTSRQEEAREDGVYTVNYDGMSCVVRDYQGKDFHNLSRENLIRTLLAHQQQIESFMRQHAVLPVKFGALLDSPQELLELVSREHGQLKAALGSIRDKVEIEVAATWDTNTILREISADPAVIGQREAIAAKGIATTEDRIMLGQIVKASMDKIRENYRRRMVGVLEPLCADIAINELVSEEMVMNVAFLVEKNYHSRFDDQVHRLDELFDNRITFRVIGPLPPYSFSSVEIVRFTAGEIQEARQALHLGNVISGKEVRSAYRRMAAAMQRSHEAMHGGAASAYAKLGQASQLLLRYCQIKTQHNDELPVLASGDLLSLSIKKPKTVEIEASRFGGGQKV